MADLRIESWVSVQRMTPQRRMTALERMAEGGRDLPVWGMLQPLIEASIAQQKEALALQLAWERCRDDEAMHAPGAKQLDAKLDRALSGLYRTLLDLSALFEEQAEPARQLLQETFPRGVAELTGQPYVEQHQMVRVLTRRLRGPLAELVSVLGLQLWVERIEALNEAYGALVSQPRQLTHEQVHDVDTRAYLSLLGVVAAVLGLFPTNAQPDLQGRAALLQPLLDQQREASQLRARRKRRAQPPEASAQPSEALTQHRQVVLPVVDRPSRRAAPGIPRAGCGHGGADPKEGRMNRRDLLCAGAASVAWMGLGGCETKPEPLQPGPSAPSAPWRRFELRTRIEVVSVTGITRAWIPLPRTEETDHQRGEEPTWESNASRTLLHRDPVSGAELLYAEWPASETSPVIAVTSRFETRDRAVDLSARPSASPTLADAARQLYLAPSAFIPTDGIVLQYAQDIAGQAGSDLEKARALYEWIVENTYRDPDVRGCGTGDIASLLESGDFGGKCADLNALFVGMARALGIPARHLYGVRVTESARYSSLGKSGDVTKGQHCRAEFWSDEHGWVPVDPADVRKLILEEDGGRDLTDPVIEEARATLFGAAEMNWVVYNSAEDLQLPDASFGSLPFLMYPQVQSGDVLCDCLVPESCAYLIETTELT